MGNKVSWLLALAAPFAVLTLLAMQGWHPVKSARSPDRHAIMAMLLIGYVAFMVVHGLLGTHRVMYLFHYFIGLLFAFAMIPLVFEEVLERWPRAQRWRSAALAVTTVLLLGSFVFYSPLTFHRPLTHTQCERRNVFQQVVDCRS